MTEPGPETWTAPDGTVWFFHAPWRTWTGWQPGEDGQWTWGIEEFRKVYPEAPPWDGR